MSYNNSYAVNNGNSNGYAAQHYAQGQGQVPTPRSHGSTPVPTPGAGTPVSAQPGQQGKGAPVTNNAKVQPLLCSGHTRPVTHLQFSNMCVQPSSPLPCHPQRLAPVQEGIIY